MEYTHTMEGQLSLKRKEVLKYDTARVLLEDSMLREISRSQNNKYGTIPLI